jgi:endonuclease YncB( thermonuclease family)
MSVRAAVVACVMGLSSASKVHAEDVWYPVPANAVFDTGDSWRDQSWSFRLYGVQACLRGTTFTNSHDLRPNCYTAAQVSAAHARYVFCLATPTRGAGAGSRIDLGTALIASGFAFPALKPDGSPVHAPYLAAQAVAKAARAGLWAFDPPDPNAILLRAMRQPSAPAAAGPVEGAP